MHHSVIAESLTARGIHPQLVANFIRELFDVNAIISVPRAGETPPFPFTKGGRQGGTETPDTFNTVVDHLIEPVVQKWETC